MIPAFTAIIIAVSHQGALGRNLDPKMCGVPLEAKFTDTEWFNGIYIDISSAWQWIPGLWNPRVSWSVQKKNSASNYRDFLQYMSSHNYITCPGWAIQESVRIVTDQISGEHKWPKGTNQHVHQHVHQDAYCFSWRTWGRSYFYHVTPFQAELFAR